MLMTVTHVNASISQYVLA